MLGSAWPSFHCRQCQSAHCSMPTGSFPRPFPFVYVSALIFLSKNKMETYSRSGLFPPVCPE